MANVLAFLFVCLLVGLALWATIRGHASSCQGCTGDCSSCGSSCTSKKKLKLSDQQLAQIKAAKAAVNAKKEVAQ
ncbi:MAG: hypothetical protein Q4B54_14355 [Coriobacteriales bacterium]|nr:hypothetical protein [Coriobacteriales bacterium]